MEVGKVCVLVLVKIIFDLLGFDDVDFASPDKKPLKWILYCMLLWAYYIVITVLNYI